MKPEALLLSVVLLAACADPEDEPPAAPEPIGAELMSFTTAFGFLNGCSRAHLYRAGRALQFQCFTSEGVFTLENRGTLSTEGLALLEAELAAADFNDTAPGEDPNKFCMGPESSASTTTLWIGDESFTYEGACPTAGIQALDEVVNIILGDIADCIEIDLLESVEPGCRAY